MLHLYASYTINKIRLSNAIKSFFSDRSGVTAIEYGLIAALVSVAIVAVLGTMSDSLKGTFTYISTQLTNATAGTGG